MSDSLTRRAFLQSSAAVATAAAIAPHIAAQPAPQPAPAWPENGTLIPDEGWRLTLDREAPWATDDIFLPEDIAWLNNQLCAKAKPLPINAPTSGWASLATGKEIILPTTVEQHFWAAGSGPDSAGEPGTPRPYYPTEYRYAAPPDSWHAKPSRNLSSRPERTGAPDARSLRVGVESGAEGPASPLAPAQPSAPPTTAAGQPREAERAGSFSPLNHVAEQNGALAPGPLTTTAPPPADDIVPINGAYFGVSWWSRPISIPADHKGKRIFLHVRGARLRAEVYLNQQLVGYSIMEELPFECDLTHAANPGGDNHLAIRITNPFGRYDWVDGSNAKWGKLALYRSHGFGGLDRGMTISAHGSLRIKDLWVLNTEEPRTVKFLVTVDQCGLSDDAFINGMVIEAPLTEVATGRSMRTHGIGAGYSSESPSAPLVPAKPTVPTQMLSTRTFEALSFTCDEAVLWSLETPALYQSQVRFRCADGSTDTRTITFGFRSFGPAGVGTDAMFRLNGKRIRLYSSISWGYWGLNGLFPVPELAEKEVTQAKKLGLNCLNFHRNLAKEEVLRNHDRLGLLRYLEPGAGKLAVGKLPAGAQTNSAGIVMEKPTTEADIFAQRYMFVKCVEMVKAFRSHPSVIEYCLQNEIGADLHNPDTLAILAAMRAEDPSRCIVLNDGFVAPPRKAAQAWYEPWSSKLHRSDEEPWGGWWDQHQGAGDQWYDEFYKSPTDFTYASPEHKALSEFGEMEGCATPDNHALMLHQMSTAPLARYAGKGGSRSYDLVDHQQIDDATNRWLDKWGFRKAFPSTEALYNALGKKCYDTWQNYLENARISDDLDFAVISGWESTAIENHSGIVDNLRNFKSDPTPISQTLQPVHPVAKQHTTVVAMGESATFDLFLLNDSGKSAIGAVTLSVITPSGKKVDLKTFPAPANQTPDVFSYLLQQGFQTPELTEEGLHRFKFFSSSAPLATQTKDVWVTEPPMLAIVGALQPEAAQGGGTQFRAPVQGFRIAVSGIPASLRAHLTALAPAYKARPSSVVDFKPGEHYHVIISSGITAKVSGTGTEAGETTGLESAPPTAANGRKLEPGEAPATTLTGHLQQGILDAVRAGTPLLCIPQANTLSDGCARQLADAGAFQFHGNVGDFRAPWMGNWYFVREHPLYAGMPVNQAMGLFYQAKGRQSNGLLIDTAPGGSPVEIIVGYSRDHDRQLGAGTFTASLGKGKIVYHRCPDFHPVLQQRFLANCLRWLTS